MKENGFYLLQSEYVKLIARVGGIYRDGKERPIYCCLQDKKIDGLYWAIPTSDLAHRTPEQIERIKRYMAMPARDIKSAFYHIGVTNRPAIYKVSSALPLTDSFIAKEFISNGIHLVLENEIERAEISHKLRRIMAYENIFPNKFEQHISSIKAEMIRLLLLEREQLHEEHHTSDSQPFADKVKSGTLQERLNGATREAAETNQRLELQKRDHLEL